ncbi:MAG: hypothetical protein P8105_01875 [Dehalococcoidia bacterium]
MRRGCIAIGETVCSICGSGIEHGDRYLLIEDEDNEESKQRVCINCCVEKNYAAYVMEKGEKVLTFFPSEEIAE